MEKHVQNGKRYKRITALACCVLFALFLFASFLLVGEHTEHIQEGCEHDQEHCSVCALIHTNLVLRRLFVVAAAVAVLTLAGVSCSASEQGIDIQNHFSLITLKVKLSC